MICHYNIVKPMYAFCVPEADYIRKRPVCELSLRSEIYNLAMQEGVHGPAQHLHAGIS